LEFEEDAETFPQLHELSRDGECVFLGPVKTHLRIYKVENMVEVAGFVDVEIRMACSRCLDEYQTGIRGDFSLTFTKELPHIDADDDEVEISAEEMGLILITDDQIDLRDAVQQEVVMALPLRPLCAEDCKGLCPQCGVNMNTEHCGCKDNNFNIKFAALKDFKVQKD